MIKKIIIPLNYDTYNSNITFNLIAYYKYVLKYSGNLIVSVKKNIDEMNLSRLPIKDCCFYDYSFLESCCQYFSNCSGDDDDYYASVQNNIIIQKFEVIDDNYDAFIKYNTNILGIKSYNKINTRVIVAKKKTWKEINSFYDILKNNFSIYNKIEESLFFERVVNGLDIKIKSINKLEFMDYKIEFDYLNSEFLFRYQKPNFINFKDGIGKEKELSNILFEENKDLVYSWREDCGKLKIL